MNAAAAVSATQLRALSPARPLVSQNATAGRALAASPCSIPRAKPAANSNAVVFFSRALPPGAVAGPGRLPAHNGTVGCTLVKHGAAWRLARARAHPSNREPPLTRPKHPSSPAPASTNTHTLGCSVHQQHHTGLGSRSAGQATRGSSLRGFAAAVARRRARGSSECARAGSFKGLSTFLNALWYIYDELRAPASRRMARCLLRRIASHGRMICISQQLQVVRAELQQQQQQVHSSVAAAAAAVAIACAGRSFPSSTSRSHEYLIMMSSGVSQA